MYLCSNMAETRGSPAKQSYCMLLHPYYKQDNTKEHSVSLVITGVDLSNEVLLRAALFYGRNDLFFL
jgi:hypothetical protein